VTSPSFGSQPISEGKSWIPTNQACGIQNDRYSWPHCVTIVSLVQSARPTYEGLQGVPQIFGVTAVAGDEALAVVLQVRMNSRGRAQPQEPDPRLLESQEQVVDGVVGLTGDQNALAELHEQAHQSDHRSCLA